MARNFLRSRSRQMPFFPAFAMQEVCDSGRERRAPEAFLVLDSRCETRPKILAQQDLRALAQQNQNGLDQDAGPQRREVYAAERWNDAAKWPQHRFAQRCEQ